MSKRWQEIYRLLFGPVFILLSPLFFLGFQVFCADLPEFYNIMITIPAVLTYFVVPLVTIAFLYRMTFLKHPAWIKKTYIGYGTAFIGLAVLSLIFQIVNYSTGKYYSFIMGGTDFLYPFDVMLVNILFVLVGSLLIYFSFKEKEESYIQFYENLPKIYDGFRDFILLFFAGISMYFLGALLTSFDALHFDNRSEALFIPSLLLMIAAPVFVLFYFYTYSMNHKLKRIHGIVWGGVILGLNIALIVCNVISPDIYVLTGQPFFPLDFLGSLNIAPFLLSLPIFITYSYLYAQQLSPRFV